MYSGRKEAAKSESQTSKTPGKRQSFSPGFPLALKNWRTGQIDRSFSSKEKVRELNIFTRKSGKSQGIFGQLGKIISDKILNITNIN